MRRSSGKKRTKRTKIVKAMRKPMRKKTTKKGQQADSWNISTSKYSTVSKKKNKDSWNVSTSKYTTVGKKKSKKKKGKSRRRRTRRQGGSNYGDHNRAKVSGSSGTRQMMEDIFRTGRRRAVAGAAGGSLADRPPAWVRPQHGILVGRPGYGRAPEL